MTDIPSGHPGGHMTVKCSNRPRRPCNQAIGLAQDDPARLEHIAASLRTAKLAVAQRMTGKPSQGMLG